MARKRKQPEETGSKDQEREDVSPTAVAKVADSLASSKYKGPFPDHERPTTEECRVTLFWFDNSLKKVGRPTQSPSDCAASA